MSRELGGIGIEEIGSLRLLQFQAEAHEMLPAFSRAVLFFVIPLTVATLVVIAWRELRRSGPA